MALDILQTIVRANTAPLSEVLMNQAFPACIQCTMRAEDNSTMQSGGECVRAYVAVALDQLRHWHDGQGTYAFMSYSVRAAAST